MIDLRSDTVTTPTRRMRQAMAEAEVGDDVFREDPTVQRLEERAAEIFQKEAALFVPSGTMGNQIACRLHTRPGQEVILESRSHMYNWELAAMSVISGCQPRPVFAERGLLSWELIQSAISPSAYYLPSTGLIALENTHNMAGGTLLAPETVSQIASEAHDRNLPVHLDGARIFNAAAALQTTVAALSRECDSVMCCLSKGLSAPVGSLLLGSSEFIQEAWVVRKMLGGGMRQTGVLAAAGLIALETMPERLYEDHENARRLASALENLPELRIDLKSVQTNIVMVELQELSPADFVSRLKERSILAVAVGPKQVRFVTHKDVNRADIQEAIETICRIVNESG